MRDVKLFLIGPPSSGKGTQVRNLKERYDLRHLSPGDLLRKEIERGTETGQKARPYVEDGELGPYEIVSELMAEEMFESSEEKGFVVDGFPRTIEQYVRFKQELQQRGERIDRVIQLDLNSEQVFERLTGRRTCSDCGMDYHKTFNPPEQDGICDACGGELYQREDDDPETIRTRIQQYRKKTDSPA